jgi:hypothetical protein
MVAATDISVAVAVALAVAVAAAAPTTAVDSTGIDVFVDRFDNLWYDCLPPSDDPLGIHTSQQNGYTVYCRSLLDGVGRRQDEIGCPWKVTVG